MLKMKNKKGLVYVFTGEGKGKTSVAMWTAIRAAAWDKSVLVIAWYKEKKWPTAMQKVNKKFNNLEIKVVGKGFYKLPTDHATEDEHKKSAVEGLREVVNSLGKMDVLVLDEVINAVDDGLIDKEELLDVLEKRGETHVVLTGRGVFEELEKEADLITEMRKVKHPFDRGIKAVKGLDF